MQGFLCIVLMVLFFIFQNSNLKAQNWRNWNSHSMSIKVHPTVNIGIGQSYGFGFQPYQLDWLQNGINANIKIKKNHSLSIAYRNTIIFKSEKNKLKYRFTASYGIKHKLGIWRMANNLMAEYHSKKETKYRYRLIYIFRLRPRNDLLVPQIKLTPYFTSFLYYNIGGNPVSQFNSRGEYMGDYVPYGLHRFRATLGLNMRPNDGLSLSVSVTRQQEFNTDFAVWNRMNVYHPEKERYVRTFKNYNIFSVSLRYYLNFVNEKKRKKKHQIKNPNFNYVPNRHWHYSATDYDF